MSFGEQFFSLLFKILKFSGIEKNLHAFRKTIIDVPSFNIKQHYFKTSMLTSKTYCIVEWWGIKKLIVVKSPAITSSVAHGKLILSFPNIRRF
jgi:hypothetical protein